MSYPNSNRWALALILSTATFAACSDDPVENADASVKADAAPVVNNDAAARNDAAPANDAMPAGDDAAAGGVRYVATLSGAQENPTVRDSAAEGTFEATLSGTTLTYHLQHNVAGATAAHLHNAIAGENGPVAVGFPNGNADQTGDLTLTAAQILELEAGRFYVNVHSPSHMGGEIRGQVLLPGEELRVAHLTAAEEVPAVTSAATGTAQFILDRTTRKVRYSIVTTLTPSALHIHRAIAGVAGPVVVGLVIAGGEATLPDLAAYDADETYINIHTAANAGGEIRGQILAPGTQLFAAHLTGGQETPPVNTTSEGRGQVTLNYARDEARIAVNHTATITAAHVHVAPGGASGPVSIGLTNGANIREQEAVTATQAVQLERGLWYLNVHTAANGGGEIRGQVIHPGEKLFTAIMNGQNEAPNPVVTNATGGAQLILSADRATYRVEGVFTMVVATAAHVHTAPAGMAGPVTFGLTIVGERLTASGAITPAQVTDLEAGNDYVNVHSAANGGGEIRGQLTVQQ